MRIMITTEDETFGKEVAACLDQAGFDTELQTDAMLTTYALVHGEAVAAEVLTAVSQALVPLAPPLIHDRELAPAAIWLQLGDAYPLSQWNLDLYAETPGLPQRLAQALAAQGFSIDQTKTQAVPFTAMGYGAATPYARQRLLWALAQQGYTLAIAAQEFDSDDNDIHVAVEDPAQAAKPVTERYEIRLHVDDFVLGQALAEQLQAIGFTHINLADYDAELAHEAGQFEIDIGPLRHPQWMATKNQLLATLGEFFAAQGIDPVGYPLQIEQKADLSEAVDPFITLHLPLGAQQQGVLLPYAGPYPQRFTLTLATDAGSQAEPLLEQLRQLGFHCALQSLPDPCQGFRIQWDDANTYKTLTWQLRAVCQQALEAGGVDTMHFPLHTDSQAPDGSDIVICWPIASALDGRLAACRATGKGYDLRLYSVGLANWQELVEAFKGWSFDEVKTDPDKDKPDWEIHYGGAPLELIDAVMATLRERYDVEPQPVKKWGEHDSDIWVYLPRQPPNQTAVQVPARAVDTPDAPFDAAAWLGLATPPETAAAQPLWAEDGALLRIGPVYLPRSQARGGWVPAWSDFAHYCLDALTATTLLHNANSVALAEPCLLEGETSTSKTSSILFLASLLGQPVARLNLNGQTDAAELIGRYVPDETGGDLTTLGEALVTDADTLVARSRQLIERAQHAGRPLTEWEIRRIAAAEGVPPHAWRWQDGLIPTAMQQGWWVILDEVNLAEPQVLERLNSVLEPVPTLVMSEHDNRVIGSTEHPCHPDFRLFATMNPAEYSGRVRLSPAYRDRWRGYRYVPAPGELEYGQMLRFLVYGEQPPVTLAGARYQAPQTAAPYGRLATCPAIEAFLAALARFHASVESAVGQGSNGQAQLGGRRKERYVFTRRALLSVLQYADSPLPVGSADPLAPLKAGIERYYLARMVSAGDRASLIQLLTAAGLDRFMAAAAGDPE